MARVKSDSRDVEHHKIYHSQQDGGKVYPKQGAAGGGSHRYDRAMGRTTGTPGARIAAIGWRQAREGRLSRAVPMM